MNALSLSSPVSFRLYEGRRGNGLRCGRQSRRKVSRMVALSGTPNELLGRSGVNSMVAAACFLSSGAFLAMIPGDIFLPGVHGVARSGPAGWAIVTGSFGTMAMYHYFLLTHRNEALSLRRINQAARREWVLAMTREGNDLLAVQTLRNAIMGASFFASTYLALLTAVTGTVFGYITETGGWNRLANDLSRTEIHAGCFGGAEVLVSIKFGVLASVLLLGTLSMVQGLRFWLHCSFLVPVASATEKAKRAGAVGDNVIVGAVDSSLVVTIMTRAQEFWWWGIRTLYFTVPVVFWLVGGACGLACATVGMVAVMTNLDKSVGSAGISLTGDQASIA